MYVVECHALCAPCLCTLSASEITFDNFVRLVDSNQVGPDIYIKCFTAFIVII